MANGMDGIIPFAVLDKKISDLGSDIAEDITEATENWLEENVDPDTGYVLDRTLSMSNAAAPADLVGEQSEKIDEVLGVKIYKKTLNVGNVTYTSAADAKMEASAKSGDKIILTFEGTALKPESTGRLYIQADGGSYANVKDISNINIPTEYTLSTDIVAIGFTSGSINKNSQITGTFKIISGGIAEELEGKVDKTTYESDQTITVAFYANYYLSGGRINSYIGQFPNGGVLVLSQIPSGCKIGLQAYSDPAYTTRVYDSGWQTSSGLTLAINTEYYYYLTTAYISGSDITDISISEDIGLDYFYTVKNQVIENTANISKLESVPPVLIKTVKTIAHRGDKIEAPKNTAPAYIIARKRGIEIAENDVTLSSDGEYVCWHDTNFSACGNLVDITGKLMYTDGTDYYYYDESASKLYTFEDDDYTESEVSVASLTRCVGSNYTPESLPLAVLKRIDVGRYKGAKFIGTQILTFSEWVLLCKQLGMDIYVDRKADLTDAQLTEVAQIVNRLGMGKNSSWLTIYAQQIPVLRAVIPDARIGFLVHPSDDYIEAYTQYNTGRGIFFNGNAKSGLSASVVQKGLDAGFEVEAYYVDYANSDTEETIINNIKTAIGYGVTGLTLDHYRVDDAFAYLLEEY